MGLRMRAPEHLTYCPAMAATRHAWRGWTLVFAFGALVLDTRTSAQEPGTEPAPAAEPSAEPTEAPSGESATERPGGVEAAAQIEASDARADAVAANSIDKDDRAPLAWHASLLWDHSYNSAGLFRAAGQTFNPTYAWDIRLSGGYNFSRDTQLAVLLPISLELTDSDSTSTRQQVILGDVGIDLMHTFLRLSPREGQDLKLSAGGRLLLPTSLASQAATTVVATRARFLARYVFERVLHGLLTAIDLRYTRRWNSSSTGVVDTPFPCTLGAADPGDSCTHMGGATTADAFLLGAGAMLGFAQNWTVGFDASLGWVRAHSLGEDSVLIETGPVALGDNSKTHWRNSRLMEITVGYDFASWFNLQALLSNDFSERGPNGRYRAPFQPYDTAVGLRLQLSFDELYLSTRTHAGG
jgi:hypothetical protein